MLTFCKSAEFESFVKSRDVLTIFSYFDNVSVYVVVLKVSSD